MVKRSIEQRVASLDTAVEVINMTGAFRKGKVREVYGKVTDGLIDEAQRKLDSPQ